MKTSKQQRIQEYQYLGWKSGNGALLHHEDILRYIELRAQLAKPRQSDLKRLKPVEDQ